MLLDVYQTSAIATRHRQGPPRQTLLFENGIQQQSLSRTVEAEFAQGQAFGIEAHIARSNVCLALYYGPSVVKDHLLECLPSENSKV
jgi:hypothetical protein